VTAPDAAGHEDAAGSAATGETHENQGPAGDDGPGTARASDGPARANGGTRGLAVRDADALIFAADMYGVQLDLLAVLTGGERAARAAVTRWRQLGYAEMARLSPGAAWIWVTRAGLEACGLHYRAGRPALTQLAHTRAVAAVRIALQSTGGYQRGMAYWRCERRIRVRHGVGIRQHLPDAEVHWPDLVPGPDGPGQPVAWAGECWAVEAELSPKTVARTAAIMREILVRTGDYGCPAAEVSVPGRPARHARALYLCSAAALGTVLRARDALGPLGARVEVRDLPPDALLP
jgi:hypothetical protein